APASAVTVPACVPTVLAATVPHVDDAGDDVVDAARRELDDAAIGLELAGIGDVGALDLAGDFEGDEAVAIEIDGEGLRAGQHDAAELGGDGAGIAHIGRDQRGQAV